MKLYEVAPKTKVRVVGENRNPPCSIETTEGEELMFYHIDGMYSYCKNGEGETVHLAAWTEVEVV
jgi:uncharacterized protein YhfF